MTFCFIVYIKPPPDPPHNMITHHHTLSTFAGTKMHPPFNLNNNILRVPHQTHGAHEPITGKLGEMMKNNDHCGAKKMVQGTKTMVVDKVPKK